MVQDRFIADQRSCGLRRHLDSVPPDTPIREIVDRCRVWERHSEQKRGTSLATGHPEHRGSPVIPGSPRVLWKTHFGRNRGFRCLGLMWSGVIVGNPGKGECAQPGRFSRDTVLADRTAHMGCPGRQSGRGEGGTSRHRDVGATGHAGFGDVGTESSVGDRAGDGVFLVWSSRTRSELMLPGGHFISVFATGLVGYYPGWPISGGMA